MMAHFKKKKKMVEILFARGLVKVLFATETFAMVN
jgi:superfamily II RNA helicase